MAHHLVPRLPSVTTLGYVGWLASELSAEAWVLMSSTFSNLRVLIFYAFFCTDLVAFIEHLQSLEVLHMIVEEYMLDDQNIRDTIQILPYVETLGGLRKFIWTVNPMPSLWHKLALFESDFQKEYVEVWFRTLPNFVAAYFSVGPDRNRYLHWSSAEFEPEEVSCDDFRHDTSFHDITLDRRLVFM
ncbi:hypothetical protein P691DRAFT_809335 [Macrolepiota fuliginosa MF-IS2]|uniref:Uncharacterized protein n=1 Tax=Macrolepiota fuliginosa MF-IS2 TaxID=1400762 RepID=A0A9P6C6G0_9AGAR|nr:hypothetical protein P691DRAFT_809335 [Macrolepiota fuliginosa MF-IS2]